MHDEVTACARPVGNRRSGACGLHEEHLACRMEFAGHHAPMKNTDVIVLGAGIVGVSVALHLAARAR